jgi:hypothetical protein
VSSARACVDRTPSRFPYRAATFPEPRRRRRGIRACPAPPRPRSAAARAAAGRRGFVEETNGSDDRHARPSSSRLVSIPSRDTNGRTPPGAIRQAAGSPGHDCSRISIDTGEGTARVPEFLCACSDGRRAHCCAHMNSAPGGKRCQRIGEQCTARVRCDLSIGGGGARWVLARNRLRRKTTSVSGRRDAIINRSCNSPCAQKSCCCRSTPERCLPPKHTQSIGWSSLVVSGAACHACLQLGDASTASQNTYTHTFNIPV